MRAARGMMPDPVDGRAPADTAGALDETTRVHDRHRAAGGGVVRDRLRRRRPGRRRRGADARIVLGRRSGGPRRTRTRRHPQGRPLLGVVRGRQPRQPDRHRRFRRDRSPPRGPHGRAGLRGHRHHRQGVSQAAAALPPAAAAVVRSVPHRPAIACADATRCGRGCRGRPFDPPVARQRGAAQPPGPGRGPVRRHRRALAGGGRGRRSGAPGPGGHRPAGGGPGGRKDRRSRDGRPDRLRGSAVAAANAHPSCAAP